MCQSVKRLVYTTSGQDDEEIVICRKMKNFRDSAELTKKTLLKLEIRTCINHKTVCAESFKQ